MNEMAASGRAEGELAAVRATPVMAQYLKVKAAHPDSLLFYRMGDFYELFFRDAEIAARDLGIALTRRGKHLGEDIPMCGVPVHAADGYLERLIKSGHRVAVCEQLEDPAEARKRGSKAVVRRDVTRLVTPGTLTEDSLLESRGNNYLASLARVRAAGELALAWSDISSGELSVMSTAPERLAADLARLDPREIIVADSLLADAALSRFLADWGGPVSPLPASRFDSTAGERRLKEHFNVAALDGFGNFSRAEIGSLGGLLDYIALTQVGRMPHLRPPRREQPSAFLLIDGATRANLELTRTMGGEKSGSLLSVIDKTMTAGGARTLAARLANPLAEAAAIAARLDEVSYFADAAELRRDCRETLTRMPDLARALGRLTVGRGGPRDLAALRDGLAMAADLAARMDRGLEFGGLPANVAANRNAMAAADHGLVAELAAALSEDLPLLTRDGGFVRKGYRAELDQNRALRDETRRVIADLQVKYSAMTGVRSLKVRHNSILGYFVEVTEQHAAILRKPDHAASFIHRQTVANAMRFTTSELAELEQRIAAASDRALAIELEIFETLVKLIVARRDIISRIAEAVSAVDVAAALAELASQRRYVRPKVDQTMSFDVRGGRHPAVEAALQETAAGSFVANDCSFSENGGRLWLLTGPNMAGKSTFLRQNALIVILAQMGSFVPAEHCHLGVVDRLFSRVGAADDLARGRSTFMVEMVETAAILNLATPRSFVILDEIGRGTATFDGLSIAWAAVEHLHEVNRCRTLFATHYHELTALAASLVHLRNATVKVREWRGDLVFLHEVVPGVADRSYGIQVARLAGLPPAVVARAKEVLEKLEQSGKFVPPKSLTEELPLFSNLSPLEPKEIPRGESQIEQKLAEVVPDELSARDALALIYELRNLLP